MEDEQNRKKMIQEFLLNVGELEITARALAQEMTNSENSKTNNQMRTLAEKAETAVADIKKILY